MKQIYNEGRVVGLSSWELYVRQVLSSNPEATLLSERQWLSASLSANCSMILKVKAGTTAGYHDYVLPEGSDLCGCSTIQGSIFEGDVTMLDEDWAGRVDDYGRLISNIYLRHPETPGEPADVPAKEDPITIGPKFADQCREYLKITGALMFQPGEWTSNIYYSNVLTEEGEDVWTEDGQDLLAPQSDYVAAASLKPDFSKRGFIRLAVSEDIENDLYILFTGFSYRTLAAGEVGYQDIYTKGCPEDGDFLGPASFPWGCIINMNVSTSVMQVLIQDLKSGGH